MSTNVHSHQKDNTHITKGNCTVLLPKNHTDTEFLNAVRYLFGISNTSLSNASGIKNLRSGGAISATKVFNFGRDDLTHVLPHGFRTPLPASEYQGVFVGTGKRLTYRPHTPEDTMGITQLAVAAGIDLHNKIAIAKNFRLVAPTLQELRSICRCMHFPPEVIADIERAPTFTTETMTGTQLSLDVILLITLDPTVMEHHEHILEVYSNEMISRKDIWQAPAHVNDRTGVPMEPPRPVESGIHYERSTVSNCVLVYHDVPYTQRYTHDCGMVVEVAQVRDHTRPEGFYKEWHHLDESGRLRITNKFIERSRLSNKTGFFVRQLEALNYMPEKEIQEIYETIFKTVNNVAEQLALGLRQASKDIATRAEIQATTAEQIWRERNSRESTTAQRLREEIESLKKANQKQEKEKEDLQREMKEARSFKKETSELLKVVASSIGLVAVVLTQFKPKKKAT